MDGIRFCGAGWVPVRGFLYLFWRGTYTKGLRETFPRRPEEDEERQGPKAVNISRGKWQSEKGGSLSEERGPVYQRRGWVAERERMSQRFW